MINNKTIDDICTWYKIINQEFGTTRDSFLKTKNIEEHPLFKCYVCEHPNFDKEMSCKYYTSLFTLQIKKELNEQSSYRGLLY